MSRGITGLVVAFYLLLAAASAEPSGELALDYGSVVQLALEQNLGLRSAGLETSQAEARWEAAQAQRNPTFTVNGFYVHNDANIVRALEPDRKLIPVARSLGYGDVADLYVTGQNQMLNRSVLAIPIYAGGRLQNQSERQRFLFQASQSELERQRQATALEAKQRYLNWLLSDRGVEVAERSLGKARQLQADTQTRWRSGTAQGYDLMQGDLAVAQAQDRLKAAQAQAQRDRLELARLLHLPQDHPMRCLDRLGSSQLLEREPLQRIEPEELSRRALLQRPELEALRQRIEAVLADQGVAAAGLLPQLTVNLNYDLIGNPLTLRGGFALISSLQIPLYDGGLTQAREHELTTREIQLKREELARAQEILLEVFQARWSQQEADSRWEVAQAARARSLEALRIARKRFQVGAGTTLELVAQTTQLEVAEYAVAQADYQRMEARARLRWALGDRQ